MEIRNTIHSISKRVARKKEASYTPVYEKDIVDPTFLLPSIIRIVDEDRKLLKKFPEAMGYTDFIQGIKRFTIIRKAVKLLSLKFYPDINGYTYYKHPFLNDYYIDSANYKQYIKTYQITELEAYAKKLGANYCKITYKTNRVLVEADNKKKSDLFAEENRQITATIHIKEAEIYFDEAHNITKPELNYFTGNKVLENIIETRLSDPDSLTAISVSLTYDLSPYMPLSKQPNLIKWEYDLNF